jgi:esterase/lipase superfamily enzyme
MAKLQLFYATNRNHLGEDRWHPSGYGKNFSADGMENLRFGRLTVNASDAKMKTAMQAESAGAAVNGSKLGDYLKTLVEGAAIEAYEEKIDPRVSQESQKSIVLGSAAFFADLKDLMMGGTDTLIFIHGFNVSWDAAVASALALQASLNRTDGTDAKQKVNVVLFTWPSDGMALPLVSYKSDRSEAAGSGHAVGRAFLKLRDFLARLNDRATGEPVCGQDIHLACHSMGNYVLQNALKRMDEYTPGNALPRLFEHVFLCAPDVDDNVLEIGAPLGRVHELARCVTVYHNRGDKAMYVSDYTKGNPERLGTNGAAHPATLHNKVHQVDCSAFAGEGTDFVQHSYFNSGLPNLDIRHSIEGLANDDKRRNRRRKGDLPNVWELKRSRP